MATLPCITLKQPWAALVCAGLKTIETRTHGRFRNLVGQRIAIHAGKGHDHHGPKTTLELARGAVVCTAMVDAAWQATADDWEMGYVDERAMCDCLPGTWLYFLHDIRPLAEPIPAKGRLGIWYVEVPE